MGPGGRHGCLHLEKGWSDVEKGNDTHIHAHISLAETQPPALEVTVRSTPGGRTSVLENRSLPCLNQCFLSAWTVNATCTSDMQERVDPGLPLQRKCRGYGRDVSGPIHVFPPEQELPEVRVSSAAFFRWDQNIQLTGL